MERALGKLVIAFSVFLEAVLLVIAYSVCKGTPPRDAQNAVKVGVSYQIKKARK
jgi:hypothetical protein